MDISNDVKGFLYMHLQWRSKFLGLLTRYALIFHFFLLVPKQCCSFCTLCTLPCPKRVCLSQHCLEGGGKGHSRHPNCYRTAYDVTSTYLICQGCGKKVFNNRPNDFCPPLQLQNCLSLDEETSSSYNKNIRMKRTTTHPLSQLRLVVCTSETSTAGYCSQGPLEEGVLWYNVWILYSLFRKSNQSSH